MPGRPGGSTWIGPLGDRDCLVRDLHQAADQLLLVGEPQGCRGDPTSSRGLSRPRQHQSFDRSGHCRRIIGSSSPTRPRWMGMLLLDPASDRAGVGHGRIPPSSDLATKFLEHFSRFPRRCRTFGSIRVSLWDDRGRLLLRRVGRSGWRLSSSCRCAPWSGCFRCCRLPPGRRTGSAGNCPTSPPGWTGCSVLADRISRRRCHVRSTARTVKHLTLALLDAQRYRRVLPHRMLDEQEFLSPNTASDHCRRRTETGFTANIDGPSICPSPTPRASQTACCSAGIPTGVDPIWFPVNVLLARRPAHLLPGPGAADLEVEVPTGVGRRACIAAGGR